MKHSSIIISIIAVLALGLIGYGYAAWSATVTTTAQVTTGTFRLGIAAAGTTDEYTAAGTNYDLTWGNPTAGSPGTTPNAYDVGSLTDANSGTVLTPFVVTSGATASYYPGVTETYTNVYPDYQAGYTVDIANGGSIPIALNTPAISWATTGTDPSVAADYTVYGWTLTDATHPTATPLASGTDNALATINGIVLPVGDVAALTINAYFNDNVVSTVPNSGTLAQGATGSQTFVITGTQFNVSTGSATITPGTGNAQALVLNSAAKYAVLSEAGIAFTGSTVNGYYGSPGAITGSPAGTNTLGTDVSAAQTALYAAYNDAASLSPVTINSELGGQTLNPGVYTCASAFDIAGQLTLKGNSSSVFIFQMGTTLTAEDGSSVILDGVLPSNVFWQVGTSATLTNTTFYGTILAYITITGTDSTVTGQLLAGAGPGSSGAITLSDCSVTDPTP